MTSSAVAATLLDLTARGVATIEQIGDGQHLLRLRRNRPATATPYEARCSSWSTSRAKDGTMPARSCPSATAAPPTPGGSASSGPSSTMPASVASFGGGSAGRRRCCWRARSSSRRRCSASRSRSTAPRPDAGREHGGGRRHLGRLRVWVVLVSARGEEAAGMAGDPSGRRGDGPLAGVRQALRGEASLAEAPAAGRGRLGAAARLRGRARRRPPRRCRPAHRSDPERRGVGAPIGGSGARSASGTRGGSPTARLLSGWRSSRASSSVVSRWRSCWVGPSSLAAFETVGEAFDEENDPASRQLRAGAEPRVRGGGRRRRLLRRALG